MAPPKLGNPIRFHLEKPRIDCNLAKVLDSQRYSIRMHACQDKSYWVPVLSEQAAGAGHFIQRDEVRRMKSFGLFQSGETKPILTYEGALAIHFGREITVFGEVGSDGIRCVVAVITLQPGQTVREVK